MMRFHALALICLLLVAPVVSADETPSFLWAKSKCAVCHGRDGSGNTEAGKKLNVVDLRTPAIQKLSDDELLKRMMHGNKRMPSFKVRLTPEQLRTLIAHIRSFAVTKP